ncbi:type I polyketide synthase [Streptomyces sulphureus]|uniref:type I polyketide synthase n=1 Tax=Streptomyces sulphureus TaxID=47758 RepID=UPI00037AC53A|nr:type I polyketide synthase [Streptomyces sulphureus]
MSPTANEEADLRGKLGQALDMVARLRAQVNERQQPEPEPIAVVGMSCRFPQDADTPDRFWSMLSDGIDATSPFPAERGDFAPYYDPDPSTPGTCYVDRGAFVSGIDHFDPVPFRISGAEAQSMDPQQRVVLESCWEALEDSGLAPDGLQGSRAGVYVGASTNDYVRMRQETGALADADSYQLFGEAQMIAGRVSYTFGMRGPAMVVDTACSSSLTAVHLACQSLRTGETDLALAGGVNALLSPYPFVLVAKAGALSPDGRCKTFDAAADGYVRGEGCGVLVLKRLSDAQAAGDDIRGILSATAVNHDGRSSGLTVPNGEAQQEVIRAALDSAGLTPAQIGYVEAHGTGTPLGDPIELRALDAVLGRGRPADRPLLVGSVKTNIGHLEAAAGIAGLFKALFSVRYGRVPAHLHLKEPNPNLDWDKLAIEVPTTGTPLPEDARHAGVSSFGASGTNVHVIVSAPPEAPPEAAPGEAGSGKPGRDFHLLPLSARTPDGLRELVARYVDQVPAGTDLGALCRTAATGRTHSPHRIAVVGRSTQEVLGGLRGYLAGSPDPSLLTGTMAPRHRNRVAFLFSGLGAQYPRVGQELYAHEPAFRDAMDRCAELFRELLDRPLLDILFADDDPDLYRTRYAQPVLFSVEYALAQLWLAWGVRPAAVLGHSIGEYAAACVAGALSLPDAARLVAARGRLMSGISGGAMVSVSLPEDEVRDAVADSFPELDVAAVNSPGDTVLSGPAEAVDRYIKTLMDRDIRHTRLRISTPGHSRMLDPMLASFRAETAGITVHDPVIPLVSNLTGELLTGERMRDGHYFADHARHPVRFADGMATLADQGLSTFVEVGPGRAMLAMGSRCLEESDGDHHWITSLRHNTGESEQILRAAGECYLLGTYLGWERVFESVPKRSISLPTSPFLRQRYFFDRSEPEPDTADGAARERARERHPVLTALLAEPSREERHALLLDYVFGSIAVMLHLERDAVSGDSDLIALGFDSLMAMNLIGRFRRDLELSTIHTRRFFEISAEFWHELLHDRFEADHKPGDGR